MRLLIELRDANEDEDGRDYGFVCEAKAGAVSVLRIPPIKDGRPGSPTEGKMLNLSIPMVDWVAEYEGCYTPGEALRSFADALDRVLALEGWEARDQVSKSEVEIDDREGLRPESETF